MSVDFEVDPALFPYAPHYFVHADGLRQHYIDEGQGPPVLMLHGNPTWSFYYRSLIERLRRTHRVIALDHIGCGRSDKPSDKLYDYTFVQRVADVTRFVESLELDEPLTLIAHDWGGMIGMGWAVDHPSDVSRFVLLNTAAFTLPEGKPFPWQLAMARSPLGGLCVRGFNAFSGIGARVSTTKPLAANVIEGLTAPYNSWANRIATLRFVEDVPLRPSDAMWGPITEVSEKISQFRSTPALLCWGMKDFVFDAHFLGEWRKRWPHAEVIEFPNAGHYVLEDETAAIGDAVERFVSA